MAMSEKGPQEVSENHLICADVIMMMVGKGSLVLRDSIARYLSEQLPNQSSQLAAKDREIESLKLLVEIADREKREAQAQEIISAERADKNAADYAALKVENEREYGRLQDALEALEPFARVADFYEGTLCKDDYPMGPFQIKLGDYRKARAALGPGGAEG